MARPLLGLFYWRTQTATGQKEQVACPVRLVTTRPRFGGLRLVRWAYRHLQARLHALTALRFLRLAARQWGAASRPSAETGA